MFDSHCHPYLSKSYTQKEIIEWFKKSWWDYMISIWVDIDSSKKSINLAKEYSFVFASIWIQPTDSINFKDSIESTIVQLEKLYLNNKDFIVWIWECGLDYHWIDSMIKEDLNEIQIKDIQRIFFRKQIQLAQKYNLPVIIHNRSAKDDTLDILKEENYKNIVFHCYSENYDFAKKVLNFAPDAMFSFSWIVTFNSAKEIQETAKKIPLHNIIVETDSPFLTPIPYRWKIENKPELVKYIIEKIIELRDESSDMIKNKILDNSKRYFNILK